MSNWIQLTSGGQYDFDDAEIVGPFTAERDLAYPLAGLNRYVRHTGINWSVAAHSVCVAETIRRMTGNEYACGAGLLHDAHEAVIGDIPTPVAWHLGYEDVKKLKEEVQGAIHFALDIPVDVWPSRWKDAVELADRAALHVEKQLLMVPEPREWQVAIPPHDWMLTMHDVVLTMLKRQTDGYAEFVQFYNEYVRPERTEEVDGNSASYTY